MAVEVRPIRHNDTLLALIIPADYHADGIHFLRQGVFLNNLVTCTIPQAMKSYRMITIL